jgi:hypothetical protein
MKRLWSIENRVKVALLLLAILLWFFVISNQDYEASFPIPLVIKGMEPELVYVEDPPEDVTISCKGRGRDLLIWRYLMKARLELNISGLSKKHNFPLVPQMISVPAGFPVRDLRVASPETLRLYIDHLAEARVPTQADCDIVPAEGFCQVGPVVCEPESVDIRGPQVLVDQVTELLTRHRHFSDVDESIEARLPLRNIFSSKILLETENVLVRATIEPLKEVYLDSLPVETTNLPKGYESRLFPECVTVILEGPASVIAGLDTTPISLVLDYETDWSKDHSQYTPSLEGPPLLNIAAMDPPEVSWTVRQTGGPKAKRR